MKRTCTILVILALVVFLICLRIKQQDALYIKGNKTNEEDNIEVEPNWNNGAFQVTFTHGGVKKSMGFNSNSPNSDLVDLGNEYAYTISNDENSNQSIIYLFFNGLTIKQTTIDWNNQTISVNL